jgi:predicted RNA-binding Zn-ribbon protein involved in translation (DUF1610 family)
MSHVSCASCRLRFAAGASAYLVACPMCGESLQTQCRPGEVLGYRLDRLGDASPSLPEAVAVALPVPSQYRPV